MVWWGGSRRISEVTLEQLPMGMGSRAPPISGYDNIHTSLLRNTIPSLRGIILCPDLQNGHNWMM